MYLSGKVCMERKARAQCLVHKGNLLLMVKLRNVEDGYEFWCLPGGAIEDGETPAEAAVRELREECCIDGTIVRETSVISRSPENKGQPYEKVHTFLVEIGSQEPVRGTGPEREKEGLLDVGWLSLSELPEKERAYLWEAGIIGIQEFRDEMSNWGGSISYPERE